MASNSFMTLLPLVRVLLLIPLDLLDVCGNTELIKRLSAQLFDAINSKKVDTNTIQYLITRTTKHTMIVLDYGILPNECECEPLVAAFKVKSNGSNLLFNKF